MKKVPTKDIVMVMGDFNAKVGKLSSTPVTGPGGLGEINSAGERLLDFCTEHNLRLVNTWFTHHPRRLYT